MKVLTLVSWNVNGLRATMKSGFMNFFNKVDADIVCLQETKVHDDDLPEDIRHIGALHGYRCYYHGAEKKGYSGTAIITRIEPIKVTNGIGKKEHDKEGRVMTAEFKTFFLVNVYVPNSGRGLPRLLYREKWDKAFLSYLKKLDKKKPVIITGDLNVAHEEIDLANPKSNFNKTAGYTETEIKGMDHVIDEGFIDSFRMFEKENGHYTYWGQWNNLRARNIGWRLDYFLVSERSTKQVITSTMLNKVMGSDHCPIELTIKDNFK